MLSPEIAQDLEPEKLAERNLYRLKCFLRLRRDHERELNGYGLLLLDRAISRAYCEIKDVGLENQAREILAEHREIQALEEATSSISA